MPAADWEPRPDQEPPLLWGPRHVVGGYYELEKQERSQRLHALGQHTDAVALWYRALTLFRLAMVGEWTIEGEAAPTGLTGEGLQMRLLGLSVASMKSALDSLLSGYYSVAFGTTRHMLETFVQCIYARFEPDEAQRWRERPGGMSAQTDPPGMQVMCQTLQANSGIKRSELVGLLDEVYSRWRLMSKGSHPSGVGLRQTVTEDSFFHSIGGTYQRDLCLAGFNTGLFSIVHLLPLTLILVRPEARVQVRKWERLRAEVDAWRADHDAELRAAEGENLSAAAVPLPSWEDIQRCRCLIRAREEAMNRWMPT